MCVPRSLLLTGRDRSSAIGPRRSIALSSKSKRIHNRSKLSTSLETRNVPSRRWAGVLARECNRLPGYRRVVMALPLRQSADGEVFDELSALTGYWHSRWINHRLPLLGVVTMHVLYWFPMDSSLVSTRLTMSEISEKCSHLKHKRFA